MRSSLSFLASLCVTVALGCSGGEGDDAPGAGGGGPAGDGRLFVPEDLPTTEVEGQEGGLTLVAFTLERRERSLEAYAAVKNEGSTPACSVGMVLECYDDASALVTSTAGSVEAGHFYVIDDGTGVVLPCIPPGQIGMAALTGFPSDLTFDHFGSLRYNFPAFTVDVLPVEGVSVGKLRVATMGEATIYEGTFTNGLDVVVSSPTVTVFPVNRVGRPLGAATSSAVMDVAPGGTWVFETTSVPDRGTGYAAFPGGSVALVP
jgi:hypothetical protein